jgi:hypothetical protein
MPATRPSRRCRIHAIPCRLIEPSRPCTGCRPTHLKNSRDREWPWKLIERDCVSHRPSHYLADPGSPGSGPFLCRPAGRANGEKGSQQKRPNRPFGAPDIAAPPMSIQDACGATPPRTVGRSISCHALLMRLCIRAQICATMYRSTASWLYI